MKWDIFYYNEELQNVILELPETLLARYVRLTDLMKEYGPNLGMPHTKSLGDGLFELRLQGREGISRVFYCTLVGRRIYMLHSFIKKTEKIPLRELKQAEMKMKRVKAHDKKNT